MATTPAAWVARPGSAPTCAAHGAAGSSQRTATPSATAASARISSDTDAVQCSIATVTARLRRAPSSRGSASSKLCDPASSHAIESQTRTVIAGGAVLEEMVDVRFSRRGVYRQNSFAFSTRFPFGFVEKTARVTLRRDVVVYPSIDAQPGFEDLPAPPEEFPASRGE